VEGGETEVKALRRDIIEYDDLLVLYLDRWG
jgi:hypothetical protein